MARVLVLKAGSGASNNLIRSLKSGDPSLFVAGCNADRFILKKSLADQRYPVPLLRDAYLVELLQIIEKEKIDLVIANSESDVRELSEMRDHLACRVFLPSAPVLGLCYDKLTLAHYLHARGLPIPLTYAVESCADIEALFARFGNASQLWCRIRSGSGSAGAIPVGTPIQARAWIEYWQQMREIPAGSFTLSEYLPGKDMSVQCLLKNGELIMSKMYERISYHVVGGAPSGVSSTSALAKMMFDADILDTSLQAILAVDPEASGIFFVDLKEDANHRACITEINAGRFANVPTIHDVTGYVNMAVGYVRAAMNEPVEVQHASAYPEDIYVLRSIDTLPAIVRGRELFESGQICQSAVARASVDG